MKGLFDLNAGLVVLGESLKKRDYLLCLVCVRKITRGSLPGILNDTLLVLHLEM